MDITKIITASAADEGAYCYNDCGHDIAIGDKIVVTNEDNYRTVTSHVSCPTD